MRKLMYTLIGQLVLLLLATGVWAQFPQPIVIQQTISLARITNRGTSFLANDFHMKIKADRQHFRNDGSYFWAPMQMLDFNAEGYYCSDSSQQTIFTSWEEDGWLHLYWTFSDRWIDADNGMMFGFTNYGGARFQNVQWWWTYNGQDVRDLPDNWQDWYKDNNGMLADVIVNRTPAGLSVSRTTGTTVNPVPIADVAAMQIPPNPIVPPGGTVVVGPGQPLEYVWPWPGEDPEFFMFYNFQDGADNYIEFKNAAILGAVPEPSGLLALAAGLTGLCGIVRRKRK